jgi:hypothetical protein
MVLVGIALLMAVAGTGFAQAPGYNPYRPVKNLAEGGGAAMPGPEWAKLPGGREMGPPAAVALDVDGESVWAFIRCDETSPLPAAAVSGWTACIPTASSSPTTRSTNSIRRVTW